MLAFIVFIPIDTNDAPATSAAIPVIITGAGEVAIVKLSTNELIGTV